MKRFFAGVVAIASYLLIVAFTLYCIASNHFHVHFLYRLHERLLACGFLLGFVALLAQQIGESGLRRRRKALAFTSLGIATVTLLAAIGASTMALRQDAVLQYSSPQGSNQVAVMGGPPASPVYRAYPVHWSLFYVKQDSEFVALQGIGKDTVTVKWEGENRAIVSIHNAMASPLPGSNPNNELVVTFD